VAVAVAVAVAAAVAELGKMSTTADALHLLDEQIGAWRKSDVAALSSAAVVLIPGVPGYHSPCPRRLARQGVVQAGFRIGVF
jgi:hypothetical protein